VDDDAEDAEESLELEDDASDFVPSDPFAELDEDEDEVDADEAPEPRLSVR
jgi:hypothetical protein